MTDDEQTVFALNVLRFGNCNIKIGTITNEISKDGAHKDNISISLHLEFCITLYITLSMCAMRCIKSNQFTQIASSTTKWETGTTLQIARNLLVNKSEN